MTGVVERSATKERWCAAQCSTYFHPVPPASRRRAVIPILAHGNSGPTGPPPPPILALKRSSTSGCDTSARSRPPGWTISATRLSSLPGFPPMPMLPSMSRAVPHWPSVGSGSKTERCSAGPPVRSARVMAAGLMSIPSVVRPFLDRAATMRPGPQPMSSTLFSQRRRTVMSAASAVLDHRSTSKRTRAPSAHCRKRGPRPEVTATV